MISSIIKTLGIKNTKSLLNQEFKQVDFIKLKELNPNKLFEKFFERKFKSSLLSVAEEIQTNEDAWKGIFIASDFCSLRLDRDLVEFLLKTTLGESSNEENFSCNKLTEIEREILEEVLFEIIENFEADFETVEKSSINPKNISLIYKIEKGKLAFSFPQEFLKYYFFEEDSTFPIESLKEIVLFMNLCLGRTKASLSELSNLEIGDLLILENSNIDFSEISGIKDLVKIDFKTLKRFNVSDEIKDRINKMQDKNALGDFQIEVKAEFRDIKMRLNELTALQNGQILDISDLIENQIFLVSQDKTVAKGQLVIVNDKFGVLIEEIFLNNPTKTKKENIFIKPSNIKTKTNKETINDDMFDDNENQEKSEDLEEDEDNELQKNKTLTKDEDDF